MPNMTTKLYAIHDSRGLMVSDACSTQDETWASFMWKYVNGNATNVPEFSCFESEMAKLGFSCDPVVVSNPKTEVRIPRELYSRMAGELSVRPFEPTFLAYEVEQFLEAGND